MDGIVSVLPQPVYTQVEEIWDSLERDLGLKGIRVTPYPHFSWQIAESYSSDELIEALGSIAKETRPFHVSTSGLGVFCGESPVVYVPVVITTELLEFHRKVWDKLFSIGSVLSPYYAPDHWVPHISLAYADVSIDTIGTVMEKLAFRSYSWNFLVNNISWIYEPSGSIGRLRAKVDFEG
ncbi:MAG: 2'-5' RNA ligase family protein [Anaerolineaceae bacterium]|nr:2'-5' RNA ligase family protein [Anaerolineaceae bacterium]